MGNTKSVCKNIFKNKTNNNNDDSGRKSSTQSLNDNQMLKNEEHDQELDILRRIIDHNPELFILNNLMMCIQFFENYDEEILSLKQTLGSAQEVKFNTCLPPYKHVLVPDILEQQVAQNINYTYIQPSLMIPSIESIQPSRIYVVYDNIEVTEQNFSSPYSNVNGTFTYNMQLKQSKHRGYALLQRLEVNPSQNFLEHQLLSGDKKKSITMSTVYSESNDDGENDDSKSDHDRSLHIDNNMSHNKNNTLIENRKIDMIESNKCENGSLKSTLINLPPRDNSNIYGNNDEFKSVTTTSVLHGRLVGKISHSSQISPAESTSSGYRSGNYTIDSDSDDISYNLIRNSTATVIYSRRNEFGATIVNKKFDEKQNLSNDELSSILPRQCFEIYNPRRNKKQKLTKKDKMIQDVIYYDHHCDIWYLSSQRFMDYFYKLFINKLSMNMGFDLNTTRITIPNASGYNEIINNVAFDKSYGPVIYCDKFELLQNITSSSLHQKYSQKQGMKNNRFAIIPCIWSPWPDMADEWIERPRIWPHYNIVEKIKEIGCHLIPKGYNDDKDNTSIHNNTSTNYNNSLKNLEWEITFPEAERYLETCMSYSQIQVYLMALILHKTFIQLTTVDDSYSGLTGNHIRNQLFWLIEENDKPGRWLENRMGEALMRLLNSLYRCISQDVPCMRDYFIRDKNIFQSKICLLRTQKQLKRIMENPIMYLLHAMQNIEYRQNFFPMLDYEILIKILTEDTFTLINPHLAITTVPNKSHYSDDQHSISVMNSSNNDSYLVDKNYNQRNGSGGFWNSAKQIKQPSNFVKKTVLNKTLIDTKMSYDQVLEISVKCAELQDPRRLCLLLDLFIKHFIKIAEYFHKYGALALKSIYIDQALRLSILLLEYSGKGLSVSESNRHTRENVKIYMEKLQTLKSRTNRLASVKKHSDDLRNNSASPPPLPPPMLPTRNVTNTDSPIFSSSLKDRYKNINDKNNNHKLSRSSYECYDGTKDDEDNKNHVTKAIVHASSSTNIERETSHIVLRTGDEDKSLDIETTYI
ncbi:uncharacterized protein [Chelonus insularis]|uniref:uncharacterized protein n=1 Tax=Chelonus insularis TaxID=460826 RepID=UPI00158AAD31|nr:uncharacterized protein LOC118064352 [Chelonus insularis]